jgi:hypothetical protein
MRAGTASSASITITAAPKELRQEFPPVIMSPSTTTLLVLAALAPAVFAQDVYYTNPDTGLVYLANGDNANCTLSACPLDQSIYQYRPSIPFSAIAIALYIITGVAQLYLGIRYRKWGFMAAMLIGCILEILGYAGRIMLYNDPWDWSGFTLQIGRLAPPSPNLPRTPSIPSKSHTCPASRSYVPQKPATFQTDPRLNEAKQSSSQSPPSSSQPQSTS